MKLLIPLESIWLRWIEIRISIIRKCSSTIKDFKIINDVKLNKNILKKRNNDTNGVSELIKKIKELGRVYIL